MTGIESFVILDLIIECVRKNYGNKYEKSILKLKTKERIVLTWTKLKQNLSYAFLSVIYQTHTVKNGKEVL